MDQLTGQIGLRRHGTTLIAKAIEWDTFSHCHHVVVFISETYVVSAEPGGVVIRPATDYDTLAMSHFALTDTQRKAIVSHAMDAYNKHLPYNMAIFPVLLASRLTDKPVPARISQWLSERPNVDCSQLVDDVYNAAKIQLFDADAELITPGDFDRLFIDCGWLDKTETVNAKITA